MYFVVYINGNEYINTVNMNACVSKKYIASQ